MHQDRLLDHVELAAEKPFIPGPDKRAYIHTPLAGFDCYPGDYYDDSTRHRVAMLGLFSVGSNFISRIVAADERQRLGIPLLAAETGLASAANAIDDQTRTHDIPEEMIKNALSLDHDDEEVRLVTGIQVYCDEDCRLTESVLVTDARLRRISFFVGGALLRQRSEKAIKKCKEALGIVRETATSKEDLAMSASFSLLRPALAEYRLFFDPASESL